MTNEYLVVTNAHSWGQAPTEKEARTNAFRMNYRQRRECKFVSYHFPDEFIKDFGVDDMGTVSWEYREGMEPPKGWTPRLGVFERSKNGHIKQIEK